MSTDFQTSVRKNVQDALAEDLGTGDVSADLINQDSTSTAEVIFRTQAMLCGRPWIEEIQRQFNYQFSVDWEVEEGDLVTANAPVCQLEGSSRSILTAERTLLNFMQFLSATATKARQYSQLVAHTKAKILDTRKTIPGLRVAQKYAVLLGGGINHRQGLFDAYLIKENHIQAAGSIDAAVARAKRNHPNLLLEVEVEELDQLKECIDLAVPRVLLDNFTLSDLEKACHMSKGKIELEASGGVNLETVQSIAETGVDFISVGALTKDIQAIDLTLLFN